MKQRGKYWKGAHTKHRLKYHLVWIPKYRKRILRGELLKSLKGLFYECSLLNGWWIEELQIMSDHIHMLVQIPPNIAVSKVVQYFKGGSSRVLRKEFPEIQEFLWGDSFWADGYFAETVGVAQEDMIKKYIRDQREG
jgi:putative transposase